MEGDIFYGSAIQGLTQRGQRRETNRQIIRFIQKLGYNVLTEHTVSESKKEAAEILEKRIGPLPPAGIERTKYVRDKMIDYVESELSAAVFEVSAPSLGTGVEFAHAYLRPRMGLTEIPILALYESGYWPNGLSTMIAGITGDVAGKLEIIKYTDISDAQKNVKAFLAGL